MNDDEAPALKRIRLAIVALFCFFNVLTVVTIECRHLWWDAQSLSIKDYLYFAVINDAIMLLPTLAVLLLRKNIYVIGLLALIGLPLFLRCIYTTLPTTRTWYAGMPPKGDWSYWFLLAFDIASVFVIVMWLVWKWAFSEMAIVRPTRNPVDTHSH
jgi:hypothetical protein